MYKGVRFFIHCSNFYLKMRTKPALSRPSMYVCVCVLSNTCRTKVPHLSHICQLGRVALLSIQLCETTKRPGPFSSFAERVYVKNRTIGPRGQAGRVTGNERNGKGKRQ